MNSLKKQTTNALGCAKPMRAIGSAAIVAALQLIPATTFAGPDPKPADDAGATIEAEQARQLYLEGEKYYQAGEFARAEVAYRAAWAIKKHWQIALNLGDCEIRNGKHREAAEHLAYVDRTIPDKERATRKDALDALVKSARAKIFTLELTVSPPDAEVRIDAAVVSLKDGSEFFLDVGPHNLEIRKTGFKTDTRTIDATAGGATTTNIALVAEGGEEARPIWPAILLGVVGAAGLGVGIGLTVASMNELDAAEQTLLDCEDLPTVCIANADSQLEASNAFLDGSIAGYVIGGAALVGMVIYLVLPSPSKNVSLSPVAGPGVAGLSTTFRFW
jgi:tetratricopeptide (TPR) repeat protein